MSTGASMGADYTTGGMNTEGLDNVGLQVVYTGTPTGSWSFEVSNDAAQLPDGTVSGGTWIALTLASAPPNPSGSGSSFVVDFNQLPYRFLRVKYTRSSGTGSLTIHAHGKAL
jgi:hypothetical protein